jgi:hypothetical protein
LPLPPSPPTDPLIASPTRPLEDDNSFDLHFNPDALPSNGTGSETTTTTSDAVDPNSPDPRMFTSVDEYRVAFQHYILNRVPIRRGEAVIGRGAAKLKAQTSRGTNFVKNKNKK